MRQAAFDDQHILVRGNRRATAQENLESLNHLGWQRRKIGKCAFLDFALGPVGFTQQHRRWRVAVGNGFNIHGFNYANAKRPRTDKN